jgi:hypothetical protein
MTQPGQVVRMLSSNAGSSSTTRILAMTEDVNAQFYQSVSGLPRAMRDFVVDFGH